VGPILVGRRSHTGARAREERVAGDLAEAVAHGEEEGEKGDDRWARSVSEREERCAGGLSGGAVRWLARPTRERGEKKWKSWAAGWGKEERKRGPAGKEKLGHRGPCG
jgi:hypothetical protein